MSAFGIPDAQGDMAAMSRGGWEDGWRWAVSECATLEALAVIEEQVARRIEYLRKREMSLDGARSAQRIVAERRAEIVAAYAVADATRRNRGNETMKD